MREGTQRTREQNIDFCVWVAACLLGAFAVLVLFGAKVLSFSWKDLSYACWIHSRSVLYCPGCGGTRAFFSILQGKFLLSAYYHPVVPYMGIVYVLFLGKGILHYASRGRFAFMKFRLGYVYAGIAITILQFLIKNICLLGFHMVWMS